MRSRWPWSSWRASTPPTWPTCGGPAAGARRRARAPRPTRPRYTSSTWTSSTTRAVIRPVMGFAIWLWTFVDVKVIDGAVNGLAWVWGALGTRPAAAADRTRPELRLRRVRRPVRARHRHPVRSGGHDVGWHQQAGFPILSRHHLPAARWAWCSSRCVGRGRPTVLQGHLADRHPGGLRAGRRHAAALPHPPARHAVHRERHRGSRRFNIHYSFGVDGIAALLIFLTTLLGCIVIIASWHYVSDRETRLLHLAAAAAGRHDRRVLRHRPVPVLRVLGGHADPDVLHHRDLGRAPQDLRRHQVLPVHAGGQRAHAGGHHRPGLLRAHHTRRSA